MFNLDNNDYDTTIKDFLLIKPIVNNCKLLDYKT